MAQRFQYPKVGVYGSSYVERILNITMPFSLANSIVSKEIWLLCLSISNRIFLSSLHYVWDCICFRTWGNNSEDIHPLRGPKSKLSIGASPNHSFLYLTWGNTNIGGIEFPPALTMQHSVANSPRSREIICPTCFFPVYAIICQKSKNI